MTTWIFPYIFHTEKKLPREGNQIRKKNIFKFFMEHKTRVCRKDRKENLGKFAFLTYLLLFSLETANLKQYFSFLVFFLFISSNIINNENILNPALTITKKKAS
jgi:hypothetical protein